MSEEKSKQTVHAVHARQKVYEGTLAFVHGMSETIDRIIVDLSNDTGLGPWLVIYFYNGQLGSFTVVGYEKYKEMGFEKVKELEISDELFMTAVELNSLHERVKDQGLDVAFRCLTAGSD
jgi:hypothetical protein